MTSQKSSISTFSFTFWSALKGTFVLPLINMIVITLAVPVSCFFAIKNYSNDNNYDYMTGLKIDEIKKVTDYYKYFIFNEFNAITFNVLIHISVIVLSILLGVMLFRFIASKKTVNVYYSLGITRKNLFVSKYLAGLLMLGVSIIIPFAACLLINISKFGSSPELWSAILYHILGYCALAFTAFSLTAAVFSGVGTIIEGITFSGILMLGPTVAIYGLQFLMSKLVLGSPYGHFYDSPFQYQSNNALATKLSGFNPILFLFNNVTKIGALARENPTDKFVWTPPAYTDVILWFAIAAGLFLLGITVFQKRKAEICGFLGVNKWLNFTVTFLIGFFPLSIAMSSPLPIVTATLIGLAIFTVLYSIVDFALIRNIKEWAKGLYKLPIHLGISLLIIIVFATGLFGFSTRIPKIEDIKSVEMASVTYSGVINPSPTTYYGYGDEDFLFSVGQSELIDDFRTAGDLKTITELHKILIDAGRLTPIQGNVDIPVTQLIKRPDIRISYQLKNGKTLSRYYDAVSVANLMAFLALDKTDRYNEIITQNLTQPITDKDSTNVVSNKMVFQEDTSTIEIIPNTLNVANQIELSPESRKLLLAAINKDLIGQTVEDRFFPKTPSMGAIRFSANKEGGWDDGSRDLDLADEMFGLVDNASASIVITTDMKNTLAFMKDNDLMTLFDIPQNTDFIGARVIPAVLPDSGPYYYYSNSASLHFMGGWSKMAFDYGGFGGTYQVTDKVLVDEIAANAHIAYFNSVPGYFIRLEMKDKEGYTTMYVPAEKMPKSVADAVARHEIVPPDFQGYMY